MNLAYVGVVCLIFYIAEVRGSEIFWTASVISFLLALCALLTGPNYNMETKPADPVQPTPSAEARMAFAAKLRETADRIESGEYDAAMFAVSGEKLVDMGDMGTPSKIIFLFLHLNKLVINGLPGL
jgi:hypothetical protein